MGGKGAQLDVLELLRQLVCFLIVWSGDVVGTRGFNVSRPWFATRGNLDVETGTSYRFGDMIRIRSPFEIGRHGNEREIAANVSREYSATNVVQMVRHDYAGYQAQLWSLSVESRFQGHKSA